MQCMKQAVEIHSLATFLADMHVAPREAITGIIYNYAHLHQLIQWSGPSVRILDSKSGPIRKLDTTSCHHVHVLATCGKK